MQITSFEVFLAVDAHLFILWSKVQPWAKDGTNVSTNIGGAQNSEPIVEKMEFSKGALYKLWGPYQWSFIHFPEIWGHLEIAGKWNQD